MKRIKKYQKFFQIFNNDILIIFLIYLITHGLILFNQGIFGDDWYIYDKNLSTLIEIFRQNGIILFGYLHYFLLSLPYPILIYHLLTFLSFFFSGVLLYKILAQFEDINRREKLLIIIFFLIFPANIARISIIMLPYSLCNLLFFLGFYLIFIYFKNRQIYLRIFSLIFFAFSFLTNSILIFYLIIPVYIFYFERKKIHSFKDFGFLIFKYLDFIFLPIIFWGVKSFYFQPFGFFKDYNIFIYHNIFLRFGLTLNYSFLLPVKEFTYFVAWYIQIIIIFLAYLIALYLERLNLFKINHEAKSYNNLKIKNRTNLYFFLLAIIIFILSVLPYILVRKIPRWNAWDSRHQLLMPLGASLIIVYSAKIFIKKNIRNILYFLFIIIFSFLFIKNYLMIQADWYKQLGIIYHYSQNQIIKNHHTFLVKDNYLYTNSMGRMYLSYEHSGMMKKAYGDESRFAVDTSFESKTKRLKKIIDNKDFFNIKDYTPTPFEYIIEINKGKYDINQINTIKLMIFERFFPKKFDVIIPAIVNIKTQKIEN